MEGQSGSWRRVALTQPTRNSLGTYGNDLPAVYLLDQNAGIETMMYFDVSDMAWMSIENLPRFLVYRCSTISQIERDGTQRLGVGLIADQATGNALPAGDVRFTCFLLQRPLKELVTEQTAVRRWMPALLPLFEERFAWPGCATTWKQFAAATVGDLQEKSTTRVEVDGRAGLRAYVKDSSQIWQQPADNCELMTIADVSISVCIHRRGTKRSAMNFSRRCPPSITKILRASAMTSCANRTRGLTLGILLRMGS